MLFEWGKILQKSKMMTGRHADEVRLREDVEGWQEHPFTKLFFALLAEREQLSLDAIRKPLDNSGRLSLHNMNIGVLNTIKEVREMCPAIVKICEDALKNEGEK